MHFGRAGCLLVFLLIGISVAPAEADTLFGLVNTGELFASTDAGVTWDVRATLPVRDAIALRARLTPDELFLASQSGVIYQSTDAGTSWNAVGTVPASDVADLLIRLDAAILILTETGTVYLSTDGGATFDPLTTLTASNFVSLGMTTLGHIYALTRTGEVYESTDQGENWVPKGVINVPNAVRIEGERIYLYVMTDTGEIARSDDEGVTWQIVGTLSQIGMRGLVRDGTSLLAATREGEVAVSEDGTSWTWQGAMNQLSLTALAVDTPVGAGVEDLPPIPQLSMSPPSPNPSIGGPGWLRFTLQKEDLLEIKVFDSTGRLAVRREPRLFTAGPHVVPLDPDLQAAGVYYVLVTCSSGARGSNRWVVLQ
jgi:photosystem II stability/assembly factor-like uncharacterized protein